MFKTARLFTQKFVKTREQYFESKKVVRKDLIKIVSLATLAQLVIVGVIEEFGIFTPDICFDARMAISPEFANFVRNGKYAGFDMAMTSSIKTFKIHEGQVKTDKDKTSHTSSLLKGF
uniref:Transmembrane protein n=1 Tax=Parastrongyloides trichosuri TaxID=131310 RepID=A0A0N4ZMP0_PARTI